MVSAGVFLDILDLTENTNFMKSEKKNKHEMAESPKKERMEKMTKSEPEYKKNKGSPKKNYKGSSF